VCCCATAFHAQNAKGVGDRELLLSVARTALRTKVEAELADKLATMVVDGIVPFFDMMCTWSHDGRCVQAFCWCAVMVNPSICSWSRF
jgi:hypothetical protein